MCKVYEEEEWHGTLISVNMDGLRVGMNKNCWYISKDRWSLSFAFTSCRCCPVPKWDRHDKQELQWYLLYFFSVPTQHDLFFFLNFERRGGGGGLTFLIPGSVRTSFYNIQLIKYWTRVFSLKWLTGIVYWKTGAQIRPFIWTDVRIVRSDVVGQTATSRARLRTRASHCFQTMVTEKWNSFNWCSETANALYCELQGNVL